MGMMSPAQASVAQLDRVLPSEGRGRGFESRRVHHIAVSGCLRQSTKHPKKPAPCGLSCFWLSVACNRDDKVHNWGVLVEFDYPDGAKKRWNIPARTMAGDFGKDVLGPPVGMGLGLAGTR